MTPEINRLAKSIKRMEKDLETFDEKRRGSSARQDLVDDIARLKERLAIKVLSLYK